MDTQKINSKNTWFHQTVVDLESPLLTYTMKILSRFAPSEEVVQESFLRLWKQKYPGEFEHYPKAWLYRVCRNLAIDILRKEKNISLEENLDQLVFRPCISETLLDSRLILQEIAKLEASEQEVLVLKFNDELSYKEIANLTGLSISLVGVKIHNALKKIRGVVMDELNRIEPQLTRKKERNNE